jgi:branched-chain amino acid aminotransferase
MTDYCYVNGELLPLTEGFIPVTDRSYLYGEGLFETMSVRAGQVRLLAEHLARITKSAAAFGFTVPDLTLLGEAVNAVVAKNALDSGALRLTLSPRASLGVFAAKDSLINVTVTARRGSSYTAVQYEQGLVAVIARSTRRNEHSPLCSHKTTGFGDNLLAKQEARSRGADEAILQNTAGNLAEGAITNLFLVSGGVVLTPRLADGALPGIMRAQVMRACHSLGLAVSETTLQPEHLFSADEAFVTNALMQIMPLGRVEGRCFGGYRPITARLMSRLNV